MPWMPSANKGICKGFKGLGLKVESFIVANVVTVMKLATLLASSNHKLKF